MIERCPRARVLACCLGLGAMGTGVDLAADPPPIVFNTSHLLSGHAPQPASADFNGDGRKDLAVVDRGVPGVRILLGVGDGTFLQAPTAVASITPASVATADFNRDGRQDLVVSNDVAREVLIALGNGDGTFTAGPSHATGLVPFFVSGANFNGDNWPDILVGGSFFGISVFLNLNDGVMGPRTDVWPDPGPAALGSRVAYRVADFDADGRDDIVVAGFEPVVSGCLGDGFVFYRSLGTSFSRTLFPGSTCPLALAAEDWNRDGRRDVLLLSFSGLQVFANQAGGSFASPSSLFTMEQGQRMAVNDFNLDGFLDIAICRSFSLFPRTGRADGTLSPPPDESVFLEGACLAHVIDDFDNDGLPDLVLSVENDTDQSRVVLLVNRSVPPPPPVGEAAALQITGYDSASGDLTFTYPPACGATDHSVVHGSLEPPNRGVYTGRICGLGTSGAGSFHPGTGSVFFLLVGNNGAIEGSYGKSSTGAERTESFGLGACDRPQVLTAACP